MTTINLYQPGKLNVYLQFPTAWDELLSSEIIEICRQQLLSSNTLESAKAGILHFIIHTRAKIQKIKLPTGWVKLMDAEQAVLSGYPLLQFLYDENHLIQAAENRIKLSGIIPTVVYGPLPGFQNLTCGEFEDAEIFFYEFVDKPAGEPLARMASILWRPITSPLSLSRRGVGGEVRLPYITQTKNGYKNYNPEKLLRQFLKLPPWRLYAIFVWYSGCRQRLPKIFPEVHAKHGETKHDDETDIMAFTKCIHAGAGPKNGSRNDIRMGKLLEFFFDMEQEAIKARELKEAYEKAANKK